MESITNNQAQAQPEESTIPHELLRELRRVKKFFIGEVSGSLKRHECFVGPSQRRRQKHIKACAAARRNATIGKVRFSPFAMTLGHGVDVPSRHVERPLFYQPRPQSTQPNQLISVFIIAIIKSDPDLFVMQKVKHKSAPGFPGGGIERNETILQAAAREFMEESRGKKAQAGANISNHNPVCIGKFILSGATNGEQGAVVVVELPESEKTKIVIGGGDQQGEEVEAVYFLTFEELARKIKDREVLINAGRVWDLYLEHLVS
ncbi:MAG: hypothetical protein A2831_02025 [Candidatus Yanofskybacteria bacterium RIFCSPHIGHO2_01_FULL_44_17]|uniref:Nudix hydrolase domain-containing protein n=1 Tax=Candidatus Yanofskybacteria bacterium RIFCSPHIGHO2_01_FULL_44_17 TaxID=1802668 RepID=A0A1F8EXP2_9BACT|nr:MAG: hypothetical protein A2831_02025 [Candidatus Yanofskybacteria bacterium RIFCSPHIGHO2_01_FULL_44_17]